MAKLDSHSFSPFFSIFRFSPQNSYILHEKFFSFSYCTRGPYVIYLSRNDVVRPAYKCS